MSLKLYSDLSCFSSKKPPIDALNQSDQMLLLTPNGPSNLQKIDYSDMDESMFDFEVNLVEKKDRVIIMMSDVWSS